MQPDNQYHQPKKSNMKFVVPIVALALLSVGLGSYIVLGKTTSNPVESSKEATSSNSKDPKEAAEAPDKNEAKPNQKLETKSARNVYEALEIFLDNLSSVAEDGICSTFIIGKIQDAPTAPYQRLQTSISGTNLLENCAGGGGAIAWFYRVSPTDKWKYLGGGHEPLSCDKYDTVDLKRAFSGLPCFDSNGNLIDIETLF